MPLLLLFLGENGALAKCPIILKGGSELPEVSVKTVTDY
jgi:hypothetical protein